MSIIRDLNRIIDFRDKNYQKVKPSGPGALFSPMSNIVWEALLGGPMQYRWMYLYERKLGSMKRIVRNKARVEGSIVQSYLVNELSMHCSLYFDLRIETRLNRKPWNFALDIHCSSPTNTRLNIFKVPSRKLFDTGTKRNLTNAEKHKAHTYILLNCEDVHPFLRYVKNANVLKKTDANENTEIISLVTLGEIKEFGDLDVGDAYMEVSENEEEFVDTYDNLEVSEAEEEFIDTYDDSNDDNKLALSDHSSDEDEVNLSDYSLND
ncbi:hypothetical protein Tco_0489140 [Tanacetum coccineum]